VKALGIQRLLFLFQNCFNSAGLYWLCFDSPSTFFHLHIYLAESFIKMIQMEISQMEQIEYFLHKIRGNNGICLGNENYCLIYALFTRETAVLPTFPTTGNYAVCSAFNLPKTLGKFPHQILFLQNLRGIDAVSMWETLCNNNFT